MESIPTSFLTWPLRLRLPRPFGGEGGIAELISLSSNLASFFPDPRVHLRDLGGDWFVFTPICPNFLKHLMAFLVRAREEGLPFGLDELRHLVLVKQNNQSARTFLLPLHPGHHVIENVLYRDEK